MPELEAKSNHFFFEIAEETTFGVDVKYSSHFDDKSEHVWEI